MGINSLRAASSRLGRFCGWTAGALFLSASLVAGCSAQGSSQGQQAPQEEAVQPEPRPTLEQRASPEMSLTDSISRLKEKAADGPVRVVVELEEPASRDAAAMQAAKAQLESVMQAAGVSQIDPIAGLPMLVMEVNAEQLDELEASGLVRSVQEDRPVGLY